MHCPYCNKVLAHGSLQDYFWHLHEQKLSLDTTLPAVQHSAPNQVSFPMVHLPQECPVGGCPSRQHLMLAFMSILCIDILMQLWPSWKRSLPPCFNLSCAICLFCILPSSRAISTLWHARIMLPRNSNNMLPRILAEPVRSFSLPVGDLLVR